MILRVPDEMGDKAIDILQHEGEAEVERYFQRLGCLPRGYKVMSMSCEVVRDGRGLGKWSLVVGE
jgi:hypothetical protein